MSPTCLYESDLCSDISSLGVFLQALFTMSSWLLRWNSCHMYRMAPRIHYLFSTWETLFQSSALWESYFHVLSKASLATQFGSSTHPFPQWNFTKSSVLTEYVFAWLIVSHLHLFYHLCFLANSRQTLLCVFKFLACSLLPLFWILDLLINDMPFFKLYKMPAH